MKIIYLHQYFALPDSNAGTRSYDLAKEFVRKGYEVEVVTTSGFIKNRRFEKKWTIFEIEGIKINVLKLDYDNGLSRWRRIKVFFQFLWFASFKLLKLKGDLVLATSTPLTIGIPALSKKWIHKTPFIFEVRDVWPEAVVAIGAIKNGFVKDALYFLEKIIYNNASAIVPLSIDMKASILARYPKMASKPVVVIENISEINRFSNIDITGSVINRKIGFTPRYTVLYAGTFGQVNGLEYVVFMAKKTLFLDSKLVYVLVGSGQFKDDIRELALAEGVLGKNLFILDPVSKEDLPKLYSESNMGSSFVINIKELWANSANKFFDSLAAGRPVLINYKGWQADVISENEVGFCLPPVLNDTAINDFINFTLRSKINPEKIISIGETYSLQNAVLKYLSIFSKLAPNL